MPVPTITDQVIIAAAAKCRDGEAALVTLYERDGLSLCVASEDTAHRVARSLAGHEDADDGDVLVEVAVVHADRTWAPYG